MRTYKEAYCQEIMQCKNDVCKSKQRARKGERSIYTCSICKFQSYRRYNVERHQKRIHWNLKLNFCCGIQFFNKGDYYVHCEQMHPERRTHTIITRNKYKIINESFDHRIADAQITDSWKFQLNRQMSNQVVVNDHGISRKVKSNLTLRYLITCNEFKDLMGFFTGEKLNSYMKILPCSKSSSNLVNESVKKSEGPGQTVEISISSTQSVEKELSVDGVNNYRTTVSSSSSISLKLPTKKLILHRFKSEVVQKREIPLRERNNNCTVQVNFAEKRVKENTLPLRQNRPKKYKRFNRRNKENVSKFSANLGEQLRVNLDRDITMPVATQRHRDFLDAIDFDRYKIF